MITGLVTFTSRHLACLHLLVPTAAPGFRHTTVQHGDPVICVLTYFMDGDDRDPGDSRTCFIIIPAS